MTDIDGLYSFENLEAFQDYTIVQIPRPGLEQTFPTVANNSVWSITLDAGQVITDADFGNRDLIAGVGSAEISGRLWDDLNGDGVADFGEPGVAGETVFIDLNDNGSFDAGEPFDTTDGSGDYEFLNLEERVYTVRLLAPAGNELTAPKGSSFSTQSLTQFDGPQAIGSGLINNDLIPDLVVANDVTNNVVVLFGNGDQTFTTGPTLTVGSNPSTVAIADVDGLMEPI